MNVNGKSEWFTPQTILTMVAMAAAFGSFFLSFDRRVSNVEAAQSNLKQMFIDREEVSREYRSDSTARLRDIDQKLDRLVERGHK